MQAGNKPSKKWLTAAVAAVGILAVSSLVVYSVKRPSFDAKPSATLGTSSLSVSQNPSPPKDQALQKTHDFTSVAFLDDMKGWVAGQGILLATSDGGKHWRQLGAGVNMQSIVFINGNAGFGVGGDRVGITPDSAGFHLLQSRDEGQTWDVISTPDAVTSVAASDPNHLWITGIGSRGLSLMASQDAGKHWSQLSLPIALTQQGPGWLPHLVGLQGDTLWLAASRVGTAGSAPYLLYRGTLDGTSWVPVLQFQADSLAPSTTEGPNSFLEAASVLSAQTVRVLTECPACDSGKRLSLTTSDDAGKHWTTSPVGVDSHDFVSLAFPTPARGWVVTRSSIYATQDGGATWVQEYSLAGESK